MEAAVLQLILSTIGGTVSNMDGTRNKIYEDENRNASRNRCERVIAARESNW